MPKRSGLRAIRLNGSSPPEPAEAIPAPNGGRNAPNGEWKNPRVLWVQYEGVKGNGLEQFKKRGTQVIAYPAELASGKLQFPYSEGR